MTRQFCNASEALMVKRWSPSCSHFYYSETDATAFKTIDEAIDASDIHCDDVVQIIRVDTVDPSNSEDVTDEIARHMMEEFWDNPELARQIMPAFVQSHVDFDDWLIAYEREWNFEVEEHRLAVAGGWK